MRLIFASADEKVVKILSKRGIRDVDSVILFDFWENDETRRAIKERTAEEVLSYLDALNLRHNLYYLDLSRQFHEIVIEVARKAYCEDTELYLTSREVVVNIAFYYFALLCGKMRVFDEEGRKIIARLPERVSEAELEILSLLREEKEIHEVAEELGKALSTVSKQISELEEKALVVCTEF